jgi:cytochrome c-type biogenesis protein CcmH
MSAFVIFATLLTALALLFILPPLLRRPAMAAAHAGRAEVNLAVLRDQMRELDADLERGLIDAEGHRVARTELERRVAEDVQPGAPVAAMAAAIATAPPRWNALALGLGVALPVLAVSLYLWLGNPAGIDPAVAKAQDPAHPLTEVQIAGMVSGLAQRLKSNPDDAEGWSMLARSYSAMNRFEEAAQAYSHLVKLIPNDADMLADYADTLAMARGKSLAGEPEQLVARALAADPRNIKALALAGSAAFERRDYHGAIDQWTKVMGLVPADSDMARNMASGIREAQSMTGESPAGGAQPLPNAGTQPAQAVALPNAPAATVAAEANAGNGVTSAAGGAEVAGTVTLDPALKGKVADSDTVFIFARAANGPRFPLAVLRKQVKDLPVRFVLDDSMSMVPNAKLSNFPAVVVGARISKTGNATGGPGDLEGMTEPVKPRTSGLKIVVNTQR